MTTWFERRWRADVLATALREILQEADDLAGLAMIFGKDGAVLRSSAYGLRSAVATLIDELRADLEPAASGFDPDRVAYGRPASLERVALLLSLHSDAEDAP